LRPPPDSAAPKRFDLVERAFANSVLAQRKVKLRLTPTFAEGDLPPDIRDGFRLGMKEVEARFSTGQFQKQQTAVVVDKTTTKSMKMGQLEANIDDAFGDLGGPCDQLALRATGGAPRTKIPFQSWPSHSMRMDNGAGLKAWPQLAPPELAQSSEDTKCLSNEPDVSIAGCSTLIQSGQINPGRLAGAYYNRGNAYERKGLFDLSIADYTQSIKVGRADPIVYNNRGIAYDEQGQHDLAIADFSEAIALNPTYAEAYSNRAIALGAKGLYDEALGDFSHAIELNPAYAQAYAGRGVVYSVKGFDVQARADFHSALAIDPGLETARRGLIRLGP